MRGVPFALEARAPCPPDMVLVGKKTCVDVLPYPNEPDEEPILGVSAVPEEYLPSLAVRDCVSLCAVEEKRLCSWEEWQAACQGTPRQHCGKPPEFLAPDWMRVAFRHEAELARLDQHPRADEHPKCISTAGVRMMTTLEEWVRFGDSYAFSRGFWSRPGDCRSLNAAHAPHWHGYANACRCCRDAEP